MNGEVEHGEREMVESLLMKWEVNEPKEKKIPHGILIKRWTRGKQVRSFPPGNQLKLGS
jgi:hypothetical protein